MNDFKTDFKAWLQEHFSQSAASGYYSSVKKVFDEHFDYNQDWQQHSKSILPLLARYFEFANREYLLDRVTIWYALDYFKKITDFIEEGNIKEQEENVEISIFDGDTFYPVCSVRLSQLYDAVLTIQTYLFNIPSNLKPKNENTPVNIARLAALLVEIETTSALKDLKDAAIHIVYDNKNNSRKKTALSHYCDFLYSLTADSNFLYPSSEIMKLIENKNPNKTIKGNYKIVQQLTGNNPLQVGIKGMTMPYTHNYYTDNYNYEKEVPPTDFVLVKEDLAEILNFDIKTIKKYFEEENKIDKLLVDPKQIEKLSAIKQTTTVIRHYFSIKSTNIFLKNGLKHLEVKHKEVDYTCEGYGYWITRLEATKFLCISHNAFHALINSSNCSRLSYIPDKVRYYAPDIEYLKDTPKFKRAAKRQIKYVKTKDYMKN